MGVRVSHLAPAAAAFLLGCGFIGKAASESEVCQAYFAKVEACAAKVDGPKADAMRQTAAKMRANFEKNGNPLAVTKSCEILLQTLEQDPDCAGAGGEPEGKAGRTPDGKAAGGAGR